MEQYVFTSDIKIYNQKQRQTKYEMPKNKNNEGRRSARSCKQTRMTRSSSQKNKKKKDQFNVKQSGRNLSLSFYNNQTLLGSKKIMLDLLPIQCVQTQHYLIPDNLQPHNFGKWEKKSGSRPNKQKKIKSKKMSSPTLQKIKKSTKIYKSSNNRKQSPNSISEQKKIRLQIPSDEQRKLTKTTNKQTKGFNRDEKTRINSRYIQKYFDGYLKKVVSSR